MKKLLGYLRRADQDFHLIRPGDRVAVGLSGGKDSAALLVALSRYRDFSPHAFELEAITIHMGLEPFDTLPLAEMCERLRVPYTVEKTQIGQVVFSERQEKNPCALCAKMRRGALIGVCERRGVTALALGHHRDDAIETLMLSVLREGRLATLRPALEFDRTNVRQIRPLIYAPEKDIKHVVRTLNLPVIPSPCPVDGGTDRADMAELMRLVSEKYPNAREMILRALMNGKGYELWNRDD